MVAYFPKLTQGCYEDPVPPLPRPMSFYLPVRPKDVVEVRHPYDQIRQTYDALGNAYPIFLECNQAFATYGSSLAPFD